MLGKVVSVIEDAFFPVDVKLALANSVTDPVKMHIDAVAEILP